MLMASQDDAVLQPSPTEVGGEFLFSQNLDRSVFNLSHIVRSCVDAGSVQSPTDMCDQLLMTRVGDIAQNGCFTIQYSPAGGGQLIQTQVMYGKC